MSAKLYDRPKRPGGDKRGSSRDRRNRKLRLLRAYGDGTTCPCIHCGTALTFETVEADRKQPGGPYAFWNVQPADRRCNLARSNDLKWSYA